MFARDASLSKRDKRRERREAAAAFLAPRVPRVGDPRLEARPQLDSPELGPGDAEPWLEAGGPGAAGPPAGGPLERSKIQEMYVKTSGNR